MYRIPLVKNIVFLENRHAQGQTYIIIVGFLDPNYDVKAVNQIKFHHLT